MKKEPCKPIASHRILGSMLAVSIGAFSLFCNTIIDGSTQYALLIGILACLMHGWYSPCFHTHRLLRAYGFQLLL